MDIKVLVKANFSFLFEKALLDEMSIVAQLKEVKKNDYLIDIRSGNDFYAFNYYWCYQGFLELMMMGMIISCILLRVEILVL